MKAVVFWLSVAFSGVLAGPAHAFLPEGEKTISLVDQDGKSRPVATLVFAETRQGISYSITWKEGVFADHFLSMRPFKCFEGPDKYWCRVPYPYDIRRVVIDQDFTDLEYDLLFVWKGATDYGINLWNGIYYKLENQGDRLVGILHEIDMDKLGVPPDAGNLRPIREVDLEEGDPDSHWLPSLPVHVLRVGLQMRTSD